MTTTAERTTDLHTALLSWAAGSDAPAVVGPAGETVTYGELHAAVDVRAAVLGDGRGPVGIALRDPVELIAWTLAAGRDGRPVFFAPLESTAAELLALAGHEGATALILDPDRTDVDGCVPYGAVAIRQAAPERRSAAGGPEVHFFTSGTSGRPKGAVRTAASLVAEGRAVGGTLGYRPGTRVLVTVPLGHAYGFALGVAAVLAARSTLVFARPLSPGAFDRQVRARGVEVVVSVPALYAGWAAGVPGGSGSLRLCVSSGAPLPPDVAERFAVRWGVRIAEQYGSTESGAISVALDGNRRPGDVGTPYPGVTVRAGTREEPAEIVVRTAHGARGYLDGAPVAENPFTADGIRLGDTGWLDADGRLQISGRRTDLINVHGRKVFPAEVEAVMRDHSAVADVAVVGLDTSSAHDEWVAAFVVAATGLDERELHEFCAGRLAAFKVPRQFFVLDEIPRGDTGKARRDVLRAHAAAFVEKGLTGDG